jgi:SAM-dependent methyltransferase
MCNPACIKFGLSSLSSKDIKGKKVLEVGSRYLNGTLRVGIEKLKPLSYLGIDIENGPCVDELCSIHGLISKYGKESFDVVICTEVLEHINNWHSAISNLKNVLKPKGVLLITTRSKGFAHHEYPFDFWRYEVEDVNVIFSDMIIDINKKDPSMPGVFVKARKPVSFVEVDLTNHRLFSILTHRLNKR